MKAYYIGSYSPAGLKGVAEQGYMGRKEAVDKLAAIMGMEVLDMTYTRGQFDVIVTVEAPDEKTALGAFIAIKSSGGFDNVVLLTELDLDGVLSHTQKAAPSYKVPNS